MGASQDPSSNEELTEHQSITIDNHISAVLKASLYSMVCAGNSIKHKVHQQLQARYCS